MSSIAWRRMQRRSIPRPKANPVTFSGSSPTAGSVSVDHSGPPHFNPTVAAVPEHVDLDARFREGEERRPEPNLNGPTEVTLAEARVEVGHRHPLVDHQALDLVKHERMRCVDRVGPVDPPDRNHADGRGLVLHDP